MRRMWIGALGIAATLSACIHDRSARGGGAATEMQCEIKVSLLPGDVANAVRRLGLADSAGSRCTLWFFDSRELYLLDHGVILRERRIAGKRGESTIKLRGAHPSECPPQWLDVHGFKLEEDRAGTETVVSWGLTVHTETGAIDAVVAGMRPIDALFDAQQRKFAADCSPIPIDWGGLVPLGPIDARVWSFEWQGEPARKLTAELWTLPDGTEFFEVSTRAPAREADAAQTELLEHLVSLDLSVSLLQEMKTRVALEYFAEH